MTDATTNPQQQQLDALEQASKQQLEALAQQRELAMESARYWDNVAKLTTVGQPGAQAAVPPGPHVSSTVLTEAHFNYLETVLKAQVDFVRALVTSTAR